MNSLRSVSARHLTRRKGRYVLTATGIMLGVAVLFAVLVMSSATTSALDDAITGGTGRVDVGISPVGSFDATLPADFPERVAALPDVEVATGSVSFRSALAAPDRETREPDAEPNIAFIEGVDVAVDQQIRNYNVARGRLFEAGAAEIVLGRRAARIADVDVGDRVLVASPSGQHSLTVVGVFAPSGVGTANSGGNGMVSLETGRSLLALPEGYTRIGVVLTAGTNVDRWIDENQARLGDNVVMTKASEFDAGFRAFVDAVNAALTLGATIALFVGGFLIFLTFSLAVAERTRTYGTMRALGALPKQVRRVVVYEAVLLGLVAGTMGLALGYGIAALALGVLSSLLGLDVPSLGLPVGAALFSVAIGVIISAVAAWAPGRRAAALSPVAAMREGAVSDERAGRPLIGSVLVGVGMVLVFTGRGNVRVFPALMVLLGSVLLVPAVLKPLAAVLGVVTRRMARGVGEVAVLHLVKERSRSAYTLALVMVVLAMIVSMGTANVSMARTVDRVIERQVGGNFQVGAPGAFDPAVEQELASIDGVRSVAAMRFGMLDLSENDGGASNVFFTVIDPTTYFDIGSFPWIDGSDALASDGLAAGGGVLLPEAQARRMDVTRGDTITLRTAEGPRPFRVAATFALVGDFIGPVVGVADLERFGAGRPNAFLVAAAPGADRDALRSAIADRVRPYDGQVQTADSIIDEAQAQLRGFFSIAYALLAVAALVGVLGLANTMVVSVLARTREVGILRSTGVLRRQARAMVLVEASTLALVAYLLALPLGWLLSTGIVSAQRDALGFSIDYVFPWLLVPVLLVGAMVVAVIASMVPARRVARLDIVNALRFD